MYSAALPVLQFACPTDVISIGGVMHSCLLTPLHTHAHSKTHAILARAAAWPAAEPPALGQLCIIYHSTLPTASHTTNSTTIAKLVVGRSLDHAVRQIPLQYQLAAAGFECLVMFP